MPKSNQPSTAEQKRYQEIARDMFRDNGRPRNSVAVVARKVMGRIIRWRDGDQFGFISTGDGKDDVYVHQSELSEFLWRAEEKVGFLVQFDLVARESFGRVASAADVEDSGKKSARGVTMLDEPSLLGRLTWRGTFGYIKSTDGNDYFCTERDFLKSGLDLDTGAVVQFLGTSGSFCIPSWRFEDATSGTRNGLRATRISPSERELPSHETMKPMAQERIVQTGLDGRIVKLNEDKNFGFIRQAEGDDIYFKINEQEDDFGIGNLVVFKLKEKTNGCLSAFDVTVVGRPKREPKEPKEFTGMVTSWHDEKGYGFITTDFEDGVVFAHSGDVGTLKKGTRVTFTVVETGKGKKAKTVSSSSKSVLRTICRNPACAGAHFVDNCPLRKLAKNKVVDLDDAASEATTCSTAATAVPCPSRKVLPSERPIPGPDDRRRMRR